MKKLKKIFSSDQSHQIQHSLKQNNESIFHTQKLSSQHNKQRNNETTKYCQICLSTEVLLQKYLKLIKLMKVKIQRLEKTVKLQILDIQATQTNQFEDFKIEFNTTSLHTLKCTSKQQNKPSSNFPLRSNQISLERELVSDKTPKLTSAFQLDNPKKSFKKFVTELDILEKDFKKNEIQNKSDLKPICQSVKNKGFIKSLNYLELIEKSNISFQSRGFEQPSIKSIFQDFSNNISSISRKQGSLKIFKENCEFGEVFLDQFSSYCKKEKYLKKVVEKESQKERIPKFESRIDYLTETILDLKAFMLHMRQLILEFTKLINLEKLKQRNKQAFYVLSVILNIFEYSEDQLAQLIKSKHSKADSLTEHLKQIILDKIR